MASRSSRVTSAARRRSSPCSSGRAAGCERSGRGRFRAASTHRWRGSSARSSSRSPAAPSRRRASEWPARCGAGRPGSRTCRGSSRRRRWPGRRGCRACGSSTISRQRPTECSASRPSASRRCIPDRETPGGTPPSSRPARGWARRSSTGTDGGITPSHRRRATRTSQRATSRRSSCCAGCGGEWGRTSATSGSSRARGFSTSTCSCATAATCRSPPGSVRSWRRETRTPRSRRSASPAGIPCASPRSRASARSSAPRLGTWRSAAPRPRASSWVVASPRRSFPRSRRGASCGHSPIRGASRSGWPRFRCASPSIPAPPSWEPRTSCSKTPGSGSAVRLQHAVPRAHALGGLADIESKAARRSLHQVGLGMGRAVHPPEPAPEDLDLARAGQVELQALLFHPHRAAGHFGLPRRPCRRSSRACHALRHSRERAVENVLGRRVRAAASLRDWAPRHGCIDPPSVAGQNHPLRKEEAKWRRSPSVRSRTVRIRSPESRRSSTRKGRCLRWTRIPSTSVAAAIRRPSLFATARTRKSAFRPTGTCACRRGADGRRPPRLPDGPEGGGRAARAGTRGGLPPRPPGRDLSRADRRARPRPGRAGARPRAGDGGGRAGACPRGARHPGGAPRPAARAPARAPAGDRRARVGLPGPRGRGGARGRAPLGRVYAAYQAELSRIGAVDRHGRERRVCEGLAAAEAAGTCPAALAGVGKIVFAEIYDFSILQFLIATSLIRLVGDAELVAFAHAENVDATRFLDRTWNRFVGDEAIADQVLPSFVERGGRGGSLAAALGGVFATERPAPAEPDGSIRVVVAPSRYREVEAAGRAIRASLEHGAPPERIALLARELAVYGDLIEDVCRRYRIPVYFRKGRPLLANGLVKACLDVVRCVVEGFPRARLEALLDSAYLAAVPPRLARTLRRTGFVAEAARPLADCVAHRLAALAEEAGDVRLAAERRERAAARRARLAEDGARLLAAVETLRGLEGPRTPAGHVRALRRALRALGLRPVPRGALVPATTRPSARGACAHSACSTRAASTSTRSTSSGSTTAPSRRRGARARSGPMR